MTFGIWEVGDREDADWPREKPLWRRDRGSRRVCDPIPSTRWAFGSRSQLELAFTRARFPSGSHPQCPSDSVQERWSFGKSVGFPPLAAGDGGSHQWWRPVAAPRQHGVVLQRLTIEGHKSGVDTAPHLVPRDATPQVLGPATI